MSQNATIPRVRLTVSPSGLEATATVALDPAPEAAAAPPDPCSADDLLGAIREQCRAAAIPWPDPPAELAGRVEAASRAARAARQSRFCVRVATGTPATEPVHEQIVWARPFLSTEFAVDPATGRIDYRTRAASQAKNVRVGDLLATITPGQPGAPGRNVFGAPLPPKSVRTVSLRAGKNVRVDRAAGQYIATAAGQMSFSSGTGLLRVDDTYDAPGNVGLASGNITHFPGHVHVPGEIEDLAVVGADGGIDVGGAIGQATVTSGGDITVGRGIAGKGAGRIVAAGSVLAAFITNADVQAEHDVVVHSEIVQSVVRTRGGLRVEAGRVVGGEAIALGEIIIAEAGSEAGVRTVLAAGEDHHLNATLTEMKAQLDRRREQLDRLNAEVAALRARQRVLSPREREQLTELMFQAEQEAADIEDFRRQIDQRAAEASDRAGRRIVILSVAWPGVTVRVGGVATEILNRLRGPVVVQRDANSETLRITAMR